MITVFTPTYNRSYIILELFDSLMKQTYRNFEWLIVDDGSTDDTEQVINKLKEKAEFDIRYYKKENEGKHIAINYGAKWANGEWFFIVDSDDKLVKDALLLVSKYCLQIEKNHKYAGVVGLRGNSAEVPILSWHNEKRNRKKKELLSKKFIDADAIEYFFRMNIHGDHAEVVRTDVLRKYPFPKYGNEKYLTEGYLWYTLAIEGYLFRWFNQVIYITEYLEDGLTHNGRKVAMKNPVGRKNFDNLLIKIKRVPLAKKIYFCADYFRFGYHSKENLLNLWGECNNKLLALIGLPLSLAVILVRDKRN